MVFCEQAWDTDCVRYMEPWPPKEGSGGDGTTGEAPAVVMAAAGRYVDSDCWCGCLWVLLYLVAGDLSGLRRWKWRFCLYGFIFRGRLSDNRGWV